MPRQPAETLAALCGLLSWARSVRGRACRPVPRLQLCGLESLDLEQAERPIRRGHPAPRSQHDSDAGPRRGSASQACRGECREAAMPLPRARREARRCGPARGRDPAAGGRPSAEMAGPRVSARSRGSTDLSDIKGYGRVSGPLFGGGW